jgi:alkanesulfonate monooxygenase SsuD/methylene tetrahydromethanopterin reductase-like flavin-dependent oxidoreductase (luciferase family)
LTTNAGRLANGQADAGGSRVALRRVGTLADGWMTHSVGPQGFRAGWETILTAAGEAGRETDRFDNVLCHHININEDADAALADAKRYLDLYYGANYTKERLQAWLAYGSPRDCIAQLRRYVGSGCNRITFRLVTMGDPMQQFRRLTEEVLPFV